SVISRGSRFIAAPALNRARPDCAAPPPVLRRWPGAPPLPSREGVRLPLRMGGEPRARLAFDRLQGGRPARRPLIRGGRRPMARVPYFDPRRARGRSARLYARLPPDKVLLMLGHLGETMEGVVRLGDQLLNRSGLDPLLREIAMLRVAALSGRAS